MRTKNEVINLLFETIDQRNEAERLDDQPRYHIAEYTIKLLEWIIDGGIE